MITIRKSFTLLEMSVVLLIIVSLASFLVSQGVSIVGRTVESQYMKSVDSVTTAIVGDSSIRDFDGSVVPFGYLNDMGSFPALAEDLWTAPSDSDKLYSKRTFTINGVSGHLYGGWNGPYFDSPNETLKENLKLEIGDFPFPDSTLDNDIDKDDVKLFANGYSDTTETILYGEKTFTERTIEIGGIPQQFTSKVTIYYIKDGKLKGPIEQNITWSDETIELPKGICAFYAELILDHSPLGIIDDVSGLPSKDGNYFVKKSAADLHTELTDFENKIVEKSGTNYTLAKGTDQIGDGETLFDQGLKKYYLFDDSELDQNEKLKEQTVTGTKTPRVIKTIKTDILLELK